jgi:hypothetical protein
MLACANLAQANKGWRLVRRGLGKGSGVLLQGVTTHLGMMSPNSHRAICVAWSFGVVWQIFYPGEHKTHDSGFAVTHESVTPMQLRSQNCA